MSHFTASFFRPLIAEAGYREAGCWMAGGSGVITRYLVSSRAAEQQSSSNDGSRACDLLLLLESFWWVIYKQLMHCIVHTLYAGGLFSSSLFLMEKFSTVEMNST